MKLLQYTYESNFQTMNGSENLISVSLYKLHRMLFLLNLYQPSLLFRYQSHEFERKPMDWFLHNSNTEPKWVTSQ